MNDEKKRTLSSTAYVALPEKDAIQRAGVLRRPEIRQLPVVVGQQDHRDVRTRLAHTSRQLDGVHVADLHAGDDQVDAARLANVGQRLRTRGHPRQVRVGDHVQRLELADQGLVELTVLGQNEGVVQAGYEQDVMHPMTHQVLEPNPPGGAVVRRWIAHAAPLRGTGSSP
jgi:hypothetical protein